MQVSPLTPENAATYHPLRLESLRNHPTAYCTDYSEEAALGLDAFEARLAPSETSITFGAWDEDRLVGIASLNRPARLRQRFRATIAGMYVVPSHRRQGVAGKLLAACIDHSRRQQGLEEVCLCITVGNDSARRVYEAFGFRRSSSIPGTSSTKVATMTWSGCGSRSADGRTHGLNPPASYGTNIG
jgi:RimJ/RimL family protein N-acetyltransferase